MPEIRLQKYLAQAGIASRRQSERLIVEGKIKVNGEVITELGSKINSEKDKVEVDGKIVKPEKFVYIILNKPIGVLSTCRKSKEKGKTILDLVKIKERLYPVGRLDKNSSGLLFLTNDGDLALKLTHPRYEHEKEYEVEIDKGLSSEDLKKLSQGIIIEGKKTLPTKIFAKGGSAFGGKKIKSKKFKMILREGRKRQIRKMCDALGYQIKNLRRIRMGNLSLGGLPVGKWRELNSKEINSLKNACRKENLAKVF